MNFAQGRSRARSHSDEPEINLIPLIDVLLVILIFLAATTTFLRQTALQVALPEAASRAAPPAALELTISRDGRYALAGAVPAHATVASLTRALREAARAQPDAALLIRADAQSAHQHVVAAMQAAQQAGIVRLHVAARSAP